jgi:hypothetical protein
MKEREFKAAFLQARREAVSQAIARIQQATGAAGVTILKLVTDPNVPAAVRLRAAECVFGMAVKGIETENIQTRLEELERAARGFQFRRKNKRCRLAGGAEVFLTRSLKLSITARRV